MVTQSTTSTLKTGPDSIPKAATDVTRVAEGRRSEMATGEESFLLCGCDSDGISHEHPLAEAEQEGAHGVGRLATKVAHAVKEIVSRFGG